MRRLLDNIENPQQLQVEQYKLNVMAAFAEAQTCRRQVLLNYFGEYNDKPMRHCDICLDPPWSCHDGTEDAQKAPPASGGRGQAFGGLRSRCGLPNQRAPRSRLRQALHPRHGSDQSHEYRRMSVIRQLIHTRALTQNITRQSGARSSPRRLARCCAAR